MKNLYFRGFMLLACIAFSIFPSSLYAQCTCTGGIPATAIDQTITISPTKASTLNFTFQQFDPAIGNLSCVSLHDTITGTSVTGAGNTGVRGVPADWIGPGPYVPGPPIPEDTTAFLFHLTLTNKISGPGITITHVYNAFMDMIPWPIMVFREIPLPTDRKISLPIRTDSALPVVMPLISVWERVNFVYTINGGMITLDGGSNYNSSSVPL